MFIILELVFLHFFQFMLDENSEHLWGILKNLGGPELNGQIRGTKAIVYGGGALTFSLDPNFFKGTSPDIDVFLYTPSTDNDGKYDKLLDLQLSTISDVSKYKSL